MDTEEWELVAMVVLGCIIGALLVLGYHIVKRVFL